MWTDPRNIVKKVFITKGITYYLFPPPKGHSCSVCDMNIKYGHLCTTVDCGRDSCKVIPEITLYLSKFLSKRYDRTEIR